MRAVLILVACASVAEAAPQRTLHGVITAEGSSRPIAGATVLTEHGDIAVTDLDGYFTLAVATTERELTVAATGYASRTVAIGAGDSLRVELVPSAGSEIIEVTGKAPEQTAPLSYQLTSDEIRILPGAGNDVLRAAQVLPGVARIPYSFGGLVLRGTSPRDTVVYLDGIEVPIAFHFGGVTSFYPSAMLSDLTLTAGGFDVAYGRAQGGLVTLTTREPRTDRWRVGGSIGLLDSSVMAEGPVGDGGIIVGVRRSYFDAIVDPLVPDDTPLPSYWDAQVRTSFGDPAQRGRITPMVFLSIDRVANHATGDPGHENQVSFTSMFVRASAAYLRTWGPLTLHVVPWIGANRLSFESLDNGELQTFARPLYPGGVRADLTRDYAWGHLRGGLDGEGGYLSHFQFGYQGQHDTPQQFDGSTTLAWANLAAWVEARIKLDGERFAIKPGVRVEAYGLAKPCGDGVAFIPGSCDRPEIVVDPRINIHEKLTDTVTLRQALGRFHQPPTPGDIDPQDGNPWLPSSYVDQASLGLDADIAGYATSVTGFFDYGKKIGVRDAMMNPDDGNTPQPNLGGLGPTFELLLEKQLGIPRYLHAYGRARSYGVEVLVKRHVGRWFGMLAYTLSQSQRTDDPRFGLGWRPFELDQRHNLNLAGSVMLVTWRLGARLQLVSGNPYSPTVVYGDLTVQQPWAGTLPMFFQLDFRADRRWHRCWGDINFYIDIQNVTNRGNIEGRDFGYSDACPMGCDQDIPGLPIVPFLGVEFIPK